MSTGAITFFSKLRGPSVWVGIGIKRSLDFFENLFYIIKTVVQPFRNSANLPAPRLPAPNSPNFKRLGPLVFMI